MKNNFIALTLGLLALSITACSSIRNKEEIVNNNLTAKPLELATQAYALIDDADYKIMITSDLERAYLESGTAQTTINHLLKKDTKPKTPEAKDNDLEDLARSALDEKKPDFKKALRFARAIKNPTIKSTALLRIAEDLPKDKRLEVLNDADKAITISKKTELVYDKRRKLLKLAKLYFESGDKQSARKTLLSSHDLLIRNTSSVNAVDFGTVAELESQLGIQPNLLCKQTRFLHKTKDRPIALARITAAYLKHGHQGQVCMPDEALIAAVSNMPEPRFRVTEQLILAEAWHASKDKDKSKQLYNGAITSAKEMGSKYPHHRFVVQGKVMTSLRMTAHTALYASVSKDFWKRVNKIEHTYQQSEALMQLITDAYLAELPELSLDTLHKIKDYSLKVTVGVELARMANKKSDHVVAKQALNEAFVGAKTAPYPIQKIDWLKEVIGTGLEIGNTKIVEQALKIAGDGVANIPDMETKIMYANQLTESAWEHKNYPLAQSLLKQSQLWYEQYLKKSKPEKSKNSGVDYHAELKISMLIDLIKTNVLLGKNATALILLDRLPSKKLQAKALVYVAITLAKKRKIQGESRADQSLLIDLEKRIKQIRKNV